MSNLSPHLDQTDDSRRTPAGTGVHDEWSGIRHGDGTEPPLGFDTVNRPRPVVRSFAFLDLCESTAFFEDEGAHQALDLVTEFRNMVRETTARRGVRVAKWIGDGAMLVGVDSGPVIATCVELCTRMRSSTLQLRAGVSVSTALPFDGDDYLARGANFASRLCNMANEGETLCDSDCREDIPTWVEVIEERSVEAKGMGEHTVLVLDWSQN